MNPVLGHLIGVLIVVLMLTFIGIWIWAWRPRHKQIFDRLADLPMEDPTAGVPGGSPVPAGQEGRKR